jgi:two-component system sensor histidine kinase KdpD
LALVVSVLVDLLARREADARKAREEARSLASMAGSLLSGPDPLPELVQRLASTFQLDGASPLVRAGDGDGWTCEATAGAHPPQSAEAATVTIPLSEDHLVALRGETLTAEDREVLNGYAAHLAVALEAHRMQAEIADKSALARANELRRALLAAVSHDLRTPLATIKAAATSLLAGDVDWDPESRRTLLETIDSEADRLSRLVANLLDMSRLRSGALPTKLVSVGLEDWWPLPWPVSTPPR